MPERPTTATARPPPAWHEPWRALHDAAYNLVVTRARQTGQPTFGDEADQRLVRCVAELAPEAEAEAYVAAWLRDLGIDLGRHVYAKPFVEDGLADALALLSEELAASGFGRLTVEEVFHRTAETRWQPSEALSGKAPGRSRALVAGLVVGTLGEALNCKVEASFSDKDRLTVKLGPGRDVNNEAGQP